MEPLTQLLQALQVYHIAGHQSAGAYINAVGSYLKRNRLQICRKGTVKKGHRGVVDAAFAFVDGRTDDEE
jgi:hypothetical protein